MPASVPVAVRIGLWMAVSAASFAAVVGIARHLSADMDVMVITFWRNLFSALLFVPWVARVGLGALRTTRLALHVVRALLMVIATVTIFFAVALMPVADATALSFTSPLFATVLAVLVLKEVVGPRRWSALTVGFLGALVVLRPGTAAFDPAALLAILSALAFAAVVVTGKMLAASDRPMLITLTLGLFAVPISLVAALPFWHWPSGAEWPWLVVLGVFGIANMYAFARALDIGDASAAMPFDFVRLIFTAGVGFVFFGERPDAWVWVGGAVILASTVYIAEREARAARLPG